jgi:CheY-like chemotaxis protein
MAALKLLVVEDDTASLELMAELLQHLKPKSVRKAIVRKPVA